MTNERAAQMRLYRALHRQQEHAYATSEDIDTILREYPPYRTWEKIRALAWGLFGSTVRYVRLNFADTSDVDEEMTDTREIVSLSGEDYQQKSLPYDFSTLFWQCVPAPDESPVSWIYTLNDMVSKDYYPPVEGRERDDLLQALAHKFLRDAQVYKYIELDGTRHVYDITRAPFVTFETILVLPEAPEEEKI